MKYQEALARALEAGASVEEVEASARKQDRQRGSIPHRNMIVALQFHPHLNEREDWVRLAGALNRPKKAVA